MVVLCRLQRSAGDRCDRCSARTFIDATQAAEQGFHAGLPANNHALWGWYHDRDQYTLQANSIFPASHALTWGNASNLVPRHPLLFSNAADDGSIFDDGAGAGRLTIPWPFFLGSPYDTARVKIYVDRVPPSDVTSDWKGEHWRQGSVVLNRNAAAGGKVGWVCVASGTPGTWKAFGTIDP